MGHKHLFKTEKQTFFLFFQLLFCFCNQHQLYILSITFQWFLTKSIPFVVCLVISPEICKSPMSDATNSVAVLLVNLGHFHQICSWRFQDSILEIRWISPQKKVKNSSFPNFNVALNAAHIIHPPPSKLAIKLCKRRREIFTFVQK